MRFLSAHYVFPVSSPPLRNGIVCVGNDGCIVDVIDTGGKLEEREKLEFYNGILVPGFVNAHCHLELSHLRNAIEPRKGLPDFISSIIKMRKSSPEIIINAAKAADEEMMKNGIVAVGDISNYTETIGVKSKSKIRYHTFVELFGLDSDRSKEILAAAQLAKNEYYNAGLSASLAPHAVYSLSEALWETLYQSYKSSPPQIVSMHHQESENENIQPHVLRCLAEASQCLLVHNTFSTEDDLAKYNTTTRRFYFVLCPSSNLFIQNRLPNLILYIKQNLCQNICLGSDSLASNKKLSILEEMKVIQLHAPEIPLIMLVQWATLNGARALGFDDFCGSFEIGKTTGVNLITGIDFEKMRITEGSGLKVLV